MDPLSVIGLTASLVQLIDSTAKAIGYLNDVKNAPTDRAKLALEATSVLTLLTDLRYRVEGAKSGDEWFTDMQSLGLKNGPLDQFKEAMDELTRKLNPERGMKKLSRMLTWTLDKKEVNNILYKIERLKTLVGLALQKDHL